MRTVEGVGLGGPLGSSDRLEGKRGTQMVLAPIDEDLTAIYADPTAEKDRLRDAIVQYQRTVPDDCRGNMQVLKQSSSWQDVVKAVRNVADERVKDRFLDFVGGNAPTMKAWLELLPAESEYFSVICGTLKLIFNVRRTTETFRWPC